MKIALLADTHFGMHKGHSAFADNMSSFLRQRFFPYLRSRGINGIIHLGDLVDSRRGISFQTMNHIRMDFIEPIIDNHIECHVLTGNHDSPMKDTLFPNAVRELLTPYQSNFTIIDDPRTITYTNRFKCVAIPWVCDENRENVQGLLNETKAKVIFGHFQLSGYAMHATRLCEEGEDDTKLQGFGLVVSGHFHERSRNGVVQYLGAPCEYSWSDAGSPRGFGILDTETLTIEYINNPFTMFQTLVYDDELKSIPMEGVPAEDVPAVYRKMVRVIVKKKSNQADFDMDMKYLEDFGPLSMKIIEGSLDMAADDIDIDESYDENPTKIFGDYLGLMQDSVGLDKKRVEGILVQAHKNSLTI